MQGFWQTTACLPCFSGQNLSHLCLHFVYISVLLSTLSLLLSSVSISLSQTFCSVSLLLFSAIYFGLCFVDFIAHPIYQHLGLPFCLNSVQFKTALLAWQTIMIMFYLYLFTYYFLIDIAKAVYNCTK